MIRPPMTTRTLLALGLPALLALAACQTEQTADNSAGPLPDIGGWRMASGKAPTEAEFAALAATCQAKGGSTDACLAELGLTRTP